MEYDAALKNRLKRIEGQVRSVLRMMEEEKECSEIVTQMSAARNALDRVIGLVVSANLEYCIRNQVKGNGGTDELIEEAVNLLVKSR
ncbi:metal-sensitive transcriptional regulator [Aliibacillus thermotolerans]|uniref:Metal-sensitive transcriptional regulator n=1 Tax=Aliibacillus thermotolerans TaxID=1834418 RepID=A0ABW0U5U4_9BACI|nr:metal-sensitive transcriptional regulator [Aliibacillus thermotolerans]MDA3128517.1 metal-sensing transcriptional repressor [Aliibacillus thermotolerans]